ncbi:hypothetical protein EDB80DRAFT_132230 [Ilyonectria destructans]|nr:hypothetical protein EDB80DRAFT_132230 [Ilyonectria destructans]
MDERETRPQGGSTTKGGIRGVQQGRASVGVVDTHLQGPKVKVTGRPRMECDAEVNGLCALLSGLVHLVWAFCPALSRLVLAGVVCWCSTASRSSPPPGPRPSVEMPKVQGPWQGRSCLHAASLLSIIPARLSEVVGRRVTALQRSSWWVPVVAWPKYKRRPACSSTTPHPPTSSLPAPLRNSSPFFCSVSFSAPVASYTPFLLRARHLLLRLSLGLGFLHSHFSTQPDSSPTDPN